MRLAYWGSGPISHYHIPALQSCGIEVVGCYSRPSSVRSREFARKFNLKHYDELHSFLCAIEGCDGIFVAVETSAVNSVLASLQNVQKPVFIEKPGATSEEELKNSCERARFVPYFLYNRRFYEGVEKLKQKIHVSKSGYLNLCFPDQKKGSYQLIINGCHAIDLLCWLLDDYSITIKLPLGSLEDKKWGFAFQGEVNQIAFQFSNPICAQIVARVEFFDNVETFELKPLEIFRKFEKMTVVEPDAKYPLRRYVPKPSEECLESTKFKPGFEAQAEEIKRVLDGEPANKLGTYSQAKSVLRIIDQLRKNL